MRHKKLVYILLLLFIISIPGTGGCLPNKKSSQPVNKKITLYFADQQAMYLLPETRTVSVSDQASKEEIVKKALEELIKGPQKEGHYPTIPEQTEILEVKKEKDILYLDFSEELQTRHPGGSAGEILTIMSIVNTTAPLAGVEKVQILITGEKQETLAGHIDISEPIKQDTAIIKK
ncbi:Sporulation and spore germination [Thermosyntropha lipolytica DSM 11003]|uniref:Sporulation and spore germination n=1 Tax=Thermosyntropha lipolytica DSM 11003 TaxID=1123382 RepID=A0A1M5JAJ2_9FIRM|nr:GerMN domain-containing protein [Thermosyntropha lipolytica]SHG37606.1 Sporulation and spore germination [Thermosyntropha lipolytica DSM 11003]